MPTRRVRRPSLLRPRPARARRPPPSSPPSSRVHRPTSSNRFHARRAAPPYPNLVLEARNLFHSRMPSRRRETKRTRRPSSPPRPIPPATALSTHDVRTLSFFSLTDERTPPRPRLVLVLVLVFVLARVFASSAATDRITAAHRVGVRPRRHTARRASASRRRARGCASMASRPRRRARAGTTHRASSRVLARARGDAGGGSGARMR